MIFNVNLTLRNPDTKRGFLLFTREPKFMCFGGIRSGTTPFASDAT